MLIKEYRICMPLSVEEYRIAQLYMIQKKSKLESTGQGSGVEIIKNESYTDGPGGSGQYTFKIYHIDSHLPAWIRTILPKSAMIVEEEGWNAYPYTRTKYKVPIIDKFTLDLETYYFNDAGEQDNVFNLNEEDRKNRIIDYLDMVSDPISASEYKEDEDPKIFVSRKTNRGPLADGWRSNFNDNESIRDQNTSIMCSYKLCRVEFKFWGLQNRIERFIDEVALRQTMLRAHRQAWCWQDEWIGLTLSDIRQLETNTAVELSSRMRSYETGESNDVRNGILYISSMESNTNVTRNQSSEAIKDPNANDNSADTKKSPYDSGDDEETFFDAQNEFQTEGDYLPIYQNVSSNNDVVNSDPFTD